MTAILGIGVDNYKLFPEEHGGRNTILDHYDPLNVISSGSYGVVYRAVDKKTGEIVAMKEEVHGLCRTTLREVNILMSLPRHPSVVEFRRVFEDDTGLVYVVMEFLETDLKRFIGGKREGFTVSEIKCLMKQILEGVKFLHDNGVVHRDLKPANILFNSIKAQIKLCDFGLSRQLQPGRSGWCTSGVGTLWYKAPELLRPTNLYSSAVDMWSVGCIMAELVLKQVLFQGRSEADQLARIHQMIGAPGNLRRLVPSLSASGLDLLGRLLAYDPDKRITPQDALNHSWFKEYYGLSVL